MMITFEIFRVLIVAVGHWARCVNWSIGPSNLTNQTYKTAACCLLWDTEDACTRNNLTEGLSNPVKITTALFEGPMVPAKTIFRYLYKFDYCLQTSGG